MWHMTKIKADLAWDTHKGAPSVVVSVLHNGRTTTRRWGVADITSGRMPSDATLYNVGKSAQERLGPLHDAEQAWATTIERRMSANVR